MLQTMIVEPIEKVFDKYFLGTGTKSIRPPEEVADLIKNGALILDVRIGLEAKKGIVRGRRTSTCWSWGATWTSCRATG